MRRVQMSHTFKVLGSGVISPHGGTLGEKSREPALKQYL